MFLRQISIVHTLLDVKARHATLAQVTLSGTAILYRAPHKRAEQAGRLRCQLRVIRIHICLKDDASQVITGSTFKEWADKSFGGSSNSSRATKRLDRCMPMQSMHYL